MNNICPYCFNQCVACCPYPKRLIGIMYTYSNVYNYRDRSYWDRVGKLRLKWTV